MGRYSSDWSHTSLVRRDFRQTHGEPEEMPHRKAGRRNHADRSKCEHEWGQSESRQWDSWWNKKTTNDEGHTLTESYTQGYDFRFCKKCRKRESQWWKIEHRVWRGNDNKIMSEKHNKTWGGYGKIW